MWPSDSGAIYFLSPELLDGAEGTSTAQPLPRRARRRTAASSPPSSPTTRWCATRCGRAEDRSTADFQVTPSGSDAVFVSELALTEAETGGNASVFRYDAADSGQLACASCDPTGRRVAGAAGDAFLAPDGLSITDDGRVFFTTRCRWSSTTPTTASTSTSGPRGAAADLLGHRPFDSGLLSVSADGTDAFFFTHDALAAAEDENRTLTRIYDARSGGGFFASRRRRPARRRTSATAPGPAPGPPPIRTAVPGNWQRQGKPRVAVQEGPGQEARQVRGKKQKAKKHNTRSSKRKGGRNHG